MWMPILLLIVFCALCWAGAYPLIFRLRHGLEQLPRRNSDWIYY